MKWFKLDSDFYNDNRVVECITELGIKSYVVWLHLLGMIAEDWHGEADKTFIIHESKLIRSCSTYRPKLEQTMSELAALFNYTCTKVGANYHIQYPKFLKKQQSYFRGVVTQSNTNRIEKKRKEIYMGDKSPPKKSISLLNVEIERQVSKNKILLSFLKEKISPSENYQEKWLSNNTPREIANELEKFKDYLDAKGKRYKNYAAAFSNWLNSPFRKKETKKTLEAW